MLLLAGCAPGASVDSASPPARSPRPVSLRVADVEGYEEVLAAHRGKVVLVDFWATWCAPCIEQFPHTIELHDKYRDRGLAVVGVSMNDPSEAAQVRDFLQQHEASFDNLLSSYESPVRAIQEFNLPGPIPCYRVYDRSGALHRELVVDPRSARQFTHKDIEAAVVELL